MNVSGPTDCVIPWPGKDDDGTATVSVLVKRTYALDAASGTLTLADEQPPLGTLEIDPQEPERVIREADVWPMKPLTDVVVRGHVYAPRGRGVRELLASVTVGDVTKTLLALGDRRCIRHTSGAVSFTDPEPFERIALKNENAYGGYDRLAEAKHPDPFTELRADPHASPRIRASTFSRYRYQRNGLGKGYLVEPDAAAVDALELPNLEDPAHRLDAERLFSGDTGHWYTMPLPWCTDWVALSTFPRVAYVGGMLLDDAPVDDYEEARRGFMPSGIAHYGISIQEAVNPRMANGASVGLQFPHFTAAGVGAIGFRLEHMHAKAASLSFTLPPGGPEIRILGPSREVERAEAVVHHVVIEPDEDRVSVVWRGAVRTLYPQTFEEVFETRQFSVSW